MLGLKARNFLQIDQILRELSEKMMRQNLLPIHRRIVRRCIDGEGFALSGMVKEIDSGVFNDGAGEVFVF